MTTLFRQNYDIPRSLRKTDQTMLKTPIAELRLPTGQRTQRRSRNQIMRLKENMLNLNESRDKADSLCPNRIYIKFFKKEYKILGSPSGEIWTLKSAPSSPSRPTTTSSHSNVGAAWMVTYARVITDGKTPLNRITWRDNYGGESIHKRKNRAARLSKDRIRNIITTNTKQFRDLDSFQVGNYSISSVNGGIVVLLKVNGSSDIANL